MSLRPTFVEFHSNGDVLKKIDELLKNETSVLRYNFKKLPSISTIHVSAISCFFF
jgi:hypothetical protein